MENTNHTIEVLNDLVQINNDRIKGFEHALKETHDQNQALNEVAKQAVDQSHKFKMDLGTEIQAFGKDIDNTTSNSGSLHRTWLDVKAFFSGHSDRSVLEECEFGEDAILKAYKTALDDQELPAFIREILTRHEQEIQTIHDKVKALRDLP